MRPYSALIVSVLWPPVWHQAASVTSLIIMVVETSLLGKKTKQELLQGELTTEAGCLFIHLQRCMFSNPFSRTATYLPGGFLAEFISFWHSPFVSATLIQLLWHNCFDMGTFWHSRENKLLHLQLFKKQYQIMCQGDISGYLPSPQIFLYSSSPLLAKGLREVVTDR